MLHVPNEPCLCCLDAFVGSSRGESRDDRVTKPTECCLGVGRLEGSNDEPVSLCLRFLVTIDQSESCEHAVADRCIVAPSTLAPHSQRRATPASRDTQAHRARVPETVHVQVRCLREFQDTFSNGERTRRQRNRIDDMSPCDPRNLGVSKCGQKHAGSLRH
jgi:hypothetical protein